LEVPKDDHADDATVFVFAGALGAAIVFMAFVEDALDHADEFAVLDVGADDAFGLAGVVVDGFPAADRGVGGVGLRGGSSGEQRQAGRCENRDDSSTTDHDFASLLGQRTRLTRAPRSAGLAYVRRARSVPPRRKPRPCSRGNGRIIEGFSDDPRTAYP